jgi:hypothetical protein
VPRSGPPRSGPRAAGASNGPPSTICSRTRLFRRRWGPPRRVLRRLVSEADGPNYRNEVAHDAADPRHDLGGAALLTTFAILSICLHCLLIGAGFVVATTVRTAIIFASVPDGLPATAAALNESSVAVGSRIGTVVFTALVAQVAL